jgi:CspA family cold shock protein
MRTGRVDFYNTAKGYGFVQPADGGPDLFIHSSVMLAAGLYEPREGDAVEFLERVGHASGKPQIARVRLLDGDEAAAVPRLKPRPSRAG